MKSYTKLLTLAVILMSSKATFAAGAWACPTLSASDVQTLITAQQQGGGTTFTDNSNHQWTVGNLLSTYYAKFSFQTNIAPSFPVQVINNNMSKCTYSAPTTYKIIGKNNIKTLNITVTLIQ